jgi:hypothetical protein
MSVAHLIETPHFICKDLGSNSEYSTYLPYNGEISNR